jgi:hypothetical protein
VLGSACVLSAAAWSCWSRSALVHRHTFVGFVAPCAVSAPPQRAQKRGPDGSARLGNAGLPREYIAHPLQGSRWRWPAATRCSRSHSSKGRLDSDYLLTSFFSIGPPVEPLSQVRSLKPARRHKYASIGWGMRSGMVPVGRAAHPMARTAHVQEWLIQANSGT